MQMLENSQEKFLSDLKEEINLREKLDRKIVLMNESFNNKLNSMQKGIENFSSLYTEQIMEVKTKLIEQINSNHKETSRIIEDIVKKYEMMEKEHNSIINEHKAFKMDTNDKIVSLNETSNELINSAKKDIADTVAKFEYSFSLKKVHGKENSRKHFVSKQRNSKFTPR